MKQVLYAIVDNHVQQVEASDRTHVLPGLYFVPSLTETRRMGKNIFATKQEANGVLLASLKTQFAELDKAIKQLEEQNETTLQRPNP